MGDTMNDTRDPKQCYCGGTTFYLRMNQELECTACKERYTGLVAVAGGAETQAWAPERGGKSDG